MSSLMPPSPYTLDPNDPLLGMQQPRPQQPQPPWARGMIPMGPGAMPPQGAPQGAPQQPAVPLQPGQTDPNLVKAALAGNLFKPREQAIERQQMLADRLRSQAPGMMESRSNIGTPNIMGAIAGAAAGMRANRLDKDAEKRALGLGGDKQSLYEQWFGAMPKVFGG